MSIEGPSKVDINCEDMEDGTCRVTYCPTEPGNYLINIKFADKHIPGQSHLTVEHWKYGSINLSDILFLRLVLCIETCDNAHRVHLDFN